MIDYETIKFNENTAAAEDMPYKIDYSECKRVAYENRVKEDIGKEVRMVFNDDLNCFEVIND